MATGICGNDITSSCLYVAAIAVVFAGIYAPLVLLLVAGLLYLYRTIYAEVGDALPLNGGAYNALLNATTKFKASIAACMTFLSYLATACISASMAISYIGSLFQIPVLELTLALLGFFAVLAIMGITESAKVALGIFIFHMGTLSIFIMVGLFYLFSDASVLIDNFRMPQPDGFLPMIFFGFSAALLGISGFESSANYIEEQKNGVFPKTLRNMWIAVTILNPMIALIALSILSIDQISQDKTSMLSSAAFSMGGYGFKLLISIDAFGYTRFTNY